MQLFYQLLANLILVAHVAYVAVVVFGLALIWVGHWRHWEWTRNFWFRVTHLTMIVVVVLESWFGILCPLTTWEKQLRELAGQESYEGDFVATWFRGILFFDVDTWVFTLCYTLFGTAVILSLWFSPPRRPRTRVDPADDNTKS